MLFDGVMNGQGEALRARFLAPGTRIGRYTIVRRLATGGMAELYLARVEGLRGFEKLVALKLVLPHLADDPDFVSMFLDEARLAATLDHPNVVHVIDVGRFGRDHFFAMEYVHGEDLRSVVRRARDGIPLGCALAIVAGVAAGLHHAHERRGPDGTPLGLVHRDVSPANVILTYDGAVKVVDFGIARVGARSKATRLGVVKGKSGYMSPEQCRGEPVDRRGDVFGLGILLWELTVGRRLFLGEHDYAVMSKIVFGLVPHPCEIVPDYPQELANVVMRALHRDPDRRQPSALAFALELEAFAHEAHLRVTASALAEFMTALFGLPPYPTVADASDSITATHADEDEATRIDPHAPPLPVERRRRGPVIALASSAAIAVAGLGFGAWAWLQRPAAASPLPTAVPVVVPAAVDTSVGPAEVVPPAPSEASPPMAEDPPLVVEVDEPEVASTPSRSPSRARKRKPSRTTSTRARPTESERPNDLFPPSD